MNSPVKIKISCGDYSADMTLCQEGDGMGVILETGNLDDVAESYAVCNVVTLCLEGLGIPKDEIVQRFIGLQ